MYRKPQDILILNAHNGTDMQRSQCETYEMLQYEHVVNSPKPDIPNTQNPKHI